MNEQMYGIMKPMKSCRSFISTPVWTAHISMNEFSFQPNLVLFATVNRRSGIRVLLNFGIC
jgi:hypothetical protein